MNNIIPFARPHITVLMQLQHELEEANAALDRLSLQCSRSNIDAPIFERALRQIFLCAAKLETAITNYNKTFLPK